MVIIQFKWRVGDIVKVPFFSEVAETKIIERRYVEGSEGYNEGSKVEYVTDIMTDGIVYTQEELEELNKK